MWLVLGVAGSVVGGPQGRKALVGGTVAAVVLVVLIILVALAFGYFKGKMRDDDDDERYIDDKQQQGAPQQQELVERPKHSNHPRGDSDDGGLLDKNGEPTFQANV
jgi:hypothetical protein